MLFLQRKAEVLTSNLLVPNDSTSFTQRVEATLHHLGLPLTTESGLETSTSTRLQLIIDHYANDVETDDEVTAAPRPPLTNDRAEQAILHQQGDALDMSSPTRSIRRRLNTSGQASASSGHDAPSAPSLGSPPVAMALPPRALVSEDDDGMFNDAVGFSWAPVLKSVAGTICTLTQAEIDRRQQENQELSLWGCAPPALPHCMFLHKLTLN